MLKVADSIERRAAAACQKIKLRRFLEQGSASRGRLWLQGQRPRSNFSRQDDPKLL